MKDNLNTIARVLGAGTNFRAYPISTILTDSRSFTGSAGTLFFALHTPQRDGHDFVKSLFDQGVRYFVIDHKVPQMDLMKRDGAYFLEVENTLTALQQLGSFCRKSFHHPLIAITGSRGKTTVKEWLRTLLGDDYLIASSPRSYNSQIGVPLSLWGIEPWNNLGVFEAGISQPGEMTKLFDILHPDIAVITNVGTEHSESFSSREAKAAEKALLAQGAKCLIFNEDDHAIANAVNALENAPKKILSYSRHNPQAPLYVQVKKGTNSSQIIYSFQGAKAREFQLPFTSDWHIENAISCLAVMLELKKKPAYIAQQMLQLLPVHTRLEVVDGVNECEVFHDSYSADVPSLLPALDFMARHRSSGSSLTVIMSDLLLDTHEPETLYRNVADMIYYRNVTRFIGIGPEMKQYAKPLMSKIRGLRTEFYENTDDFLFRNSGSDFLHELILVKGLPQFGFDRIVDLLEAQQHETVMEVNLDAVISNYNFFRSKLLPTTGIVCMLKASGYGAGSLELAKALQSQGAAYLAVAVHDEGVELRQAGITMPIIVLNPKVENFKSLFTHHLEPEIYSFEFLQRLIQEAKKSGVKDYPIHIKLDTGMHRLGFRKEHLPQLLEILTSQDQVRPKSIFSHLCAADEPLEDDYTLSQFKYFDECCDTIQAAFPYHILRHILNSTGITRFPEQQHDMVRLGIGLYGVKTLHDGSQDGLRPVSAVKSPIISLKKWPPGTTIGYNRRGVLKRDTLVATVPIGYADGLNRHLGYGHFSVMLNGVRCPIIGTICMDACMIDVTDAGEVKIGDRVEIFGDAIPVEEVADVLQTIPYEVLTSISPRIKRVYYRE